MYGNTYSVCHPSRRTGIRDVTSFCCRDPRGGGSYKEVHAWTYNGETEWYGYQPTVADMDKIVGTVESYAAMFQAEDMNMTM